MSCSLRQFLIDSLNQKPSRTKLSSSSRMGVKPQVPDCLPRNGVFTDTHSPSVAVFSIKNGFKSVGVSKNASRKKRDGFLPESLLHQLSIGKRGARPPRLERGTCGLEDRCSIQLSYGRFLESRNVIHHSISR